MEILYTLKQKQFAKKKMFQRLPQRIAIRTTIFNIVLDTYINAMYQTPILMVLLEM